MLVQFSSVQTFPLIILVYKLKDSFDYLWLLIGVVLLKKFFYLILYGRFSDFKLFKIEVNIWLISMLIASY